MDYYSFNRHRRDGRLSRPCWLTDSGRFTHKEVTRPAASLAQDRVRTPAEPAVYTTMLRHLCVSVIVCLCVFIFFLNFNILLPFKLAVNRPINCCCMTSRRCSQVDFVYVTAADDDTTTSSRIGVYCGRRLPPAIMSGPSGQLMVTFVSRPQSAGVGFRAVYSFVTGLWSHTSLFHR